MRNFAGAMISGLALLAAASPSVAASPRQTPVAAAESADVAVTRHAITLRDGRRISYTARAGFLRLVNDATSEETAHVYFVSYTADQPAGAAPRPVTFTFPGGPGSAATLSRSAPLVTEARNGRAQVIDNPDSLLGATDLVLIDPVGTGYSRMTKPEFAPLFYGIKADRDALVEVVRLYLQRFQTTDAPIFFTGGSWGSVRSILVADAAIDRGIPVRGIMVSAEGASLSITGSETYYANLIPGFAVIAQAHGKLPADLQADRAKAIAEAKAWAFDSYLPAIAKGNLLPAQDRRRLAVEMARYSGLKPEVIERYGLKIGAEAFTNELLRDEGKSVGFYDTRIAGPLQTSAYDPTRDPSLMARGSAYPSLAERTLLNRTLGMTSDSYYAGPFGGGWPVRAGFDDWMAVKWGMGLEQVPVGLGVDIILPAFQRIIGKGVHAFFGQGLYDWACSPFGVDYVRSQLPADRAEQMTVVHYESGHGVPAVQFAKDATAFIGRTLQAPAPPMPHPLMGE
ncbi:carboxypeptidase C (cathepsin A) [Sphingobium sp. OAS761]|uniref:hypothetical protein n=1 Tax=Sphingobium sp. OAS761 TaxID=2817901 RepID=UPI00209D583C|nr:hypothetical protein [Sphingobium sp. OAS761]MCP1469779.1 carboxypeptidase C (cathepsin A) [Sphingobium sp. OAS761]